jgi:uncharacterized protein DUF4440
VARTMGPASTTLAGNSVTSDLLPAGSRSINTRGDLRWRSQRLSDVTVTVAGDAAVLTAAVTDEVTRDRHDLAFQLRLTQTWVRTAGRLAVSRRARQPPRIVSRYRGSQSMQRQKGCPAGSRNTRKVVPG